MTGPDEVRLDEAQAAAVRYLVAHPEQVGRASGREPVREALLWLTRGRWPRRHGWPVVPRLGTPWQDTISAERHGWRCRAAYLPGAEDMVFEVDYQICRRCLLGWVEQPYTLPRYQRRGLARAGVAALRAEHPGLSWHTLGQRMPEAARSGSPPVRVCPAATSRGRCARTSRPADDLPGQQLGEPAGQRRDRHVPDVGCTAGRRRPNRDRPAAAAPAGPADVDAGSERATAAGDGALLTDVRPEAKS